jgi:signal transduction histidine kinase
VGRTGATRRVPATSSRPSCDDREVEESGRSGQLAGQLGDELAHLLRCDAELAMAERMPEIRRTATEVAVLSAGVVALLFALAGGTWAAGLGLASVVPAWTSALILAGAWLLVAVVLLVVHRDPRRLVARLSDESQAAMLASRRAERDEAERNLRDTAERLAEALLHDAEARGADAAAAAARRGKDEAEREAAQLIAQIADALREPGKAGRGLLDRLRGAEEKPG